MEQQRPSWNLLSDRPGNPCSPGGPFSELLSLTALFKPLERILQSYPSANYIGAVAQVQHLNVLNRVSNPDALRSGYDDCVRESELTPGLRLSHARVTAYEMHRAGIGRLHLLHELVVS
jgi:hypothetical protein